VPLVFIHGVNNRDTDEDYARGVAARRTMFEELVAATIVKRGFPDFKVAADIYWGDLGVSFGWNLRSVPTTHVVESLGPEGSGAQNLDILQLVSKTRPSKTEGVETLGTVPPLVDAAQQDPAGLVRAIFAPEADRFAVTDLKPPKAAMLESDVDKADAEGAHLGLLLMAAEQLARDVEKPENRALIQGTTDSQVLNKIEEQVQARYQQLAKPRLEAQASDKEHLGKGGNPIGWTLDHLKKMVNAAKNAVTGAVTETERGASLVALKALRDGVSRRAFRFLGDVFVYLHHGRTAAPAIYERVKSGVLALNGRTNSKGEREPFIVVSHSFGSEIFYDLLISHQLDAVTVDLWVTAGAQTSLFAEMLLFADIPQPLPPDTSTFSLGRPPTVKKWVNFYDEADVLSYLHEPVFGSTAVKDIPVRAGANLTNAHGHYFADPGFYERIAKEL